MRTLNTKEWIAVSVGIVLIIYFFVLSGSGLFSAEVSNPVASINSISTTTNTMNTSENTYNLPGIIVTDVVVGDGAVAVAGKKVRVHYVGSFPNGEVFDSSIPRGQPFEFTLGAGQVIRGWDEGVVGMKVGGKRKLTISPEKGYGAQGAGGVIPPNATLNFEVELLGVN